MGRDRLNVTQNIPQSHPKCRRSSPQRVWPWSGRGHRRRRADGRAERGRVRRPGRGQKPSARMDGRHDRPHPREMGVGGGERLEILLGEAVPPSSGQLGGDGITLQRENA